MEEIQVESLIQSIRLWKRHRSSFFLFTNKCKKNFNLTLKQNVNCSIIQTTH